MGALVLAEGGTFQPPGPESFDYPPIFAGVTKPIVQIVIALVVVAAFFVVASGRLKLVPGRFQVGVEYLYDFIRNSVGRDMIGSKDLRPFIPFLLALFSFILVNNIFGFIPFFQLPTMAHIAFPAGLAILTWIVFNAVGVKRHGFFGYFKNMMFPPGVPKPVYVLLAPIELVSTLVFRPLTLTLRLFATMFAGHLMLLVFIMGGEYLLVEASAGLKLASPIAFAAAIAMSFFELLVQVLQAYIFTALTANYIGGALAEEH